MTRIVAIGEQDRVEGLVLAGVEVLAAPSAEAARAAWASLDDGVAVVVLTPAAAAAVEGSFCPPRRLQVVMPE